MDICMAFSGDVDHRPLLLHGLRPDMSLSGSRDQDLAMASSGSTGSQQALPLHPRVFKPAFLHTAQIVLLLFLSHFSTPYLYITVACAVGGPCSGPGL